MNLYLFFILFSLIMLINVAIGLWAGRNDQNTEDYFLGSRSLSSFSLIATIIATQVGGGTLIGASPRSFSTGL